MTLNEQKLAEVVEQLRHQDQQLAAFAHQLEGLGPDTILSVPNELLADIDQAARPGSALVPELQFSTRV